MFVIACGSATDGEQQVNDAEPNETEQSESQPANNVVTNNGTEEDIVDENSTMQSTDMNEQAQNNEPASQDTSTGNSELPEPIELNEEIHEDGIAFTLETITFEEDYITASFHATNTAGHAIELAAKGRAEEDDLGGITLMDDTGFAYRYIADKRIHRIKVLDGEEVTGTVSFFGRLRDDAQSLTLTFNPDEYTNREPTFTFENIQINR